MARAFRGLRRDPDQRYDVIVVGAGVGGLVCANLLARESLKVLLIEQHYMVGGYCSTFRRAGYTFDAATHFYPLLGNSATLTGKVLSHLGSRTHWIKMDPVDHFHLPDGSEFLVPADFQRYIDRLEAEFPDEVKSLSCFFEMVKEAYLTGLLFHFRGRDTDRRSRVSQLTVRDVLDRCFRSPRLKLILCGDCGHWGAPPSRTSFVFDSMLRLAYFLGNYYPAGGSQAFVDDLAARFEESGGHILMSSDVLRIRTEKDVATGVDVETGTGRSRHRITVQAGCIVSNADARHTIDLIASGSVPPDWRRRVESLRPSAACFLLHLGLRGVTADELRAVDGYHWSSWNPDDVGSDAFKIFVPTLYEPSMAPSQEHIIIVQKLTMTSRKNVGDWGFHKQLVENYIMDNLERILPGLSRRIAVRTSASADTSRRFTRNYAGSMLGWELSPDQLDKERLGPEGPVRNLWTTGHWSVPGGGITPVIISAQMAAQRVLTGRSQPIGEHGLNVPVASGLHFAPARGANA